MAVEERPPFAPAPGPAPAPPPPRPEARPYACWALIGMCTALYLYECWRSGNLNDPEILGGVNGAGLAAHQWWRLLTYAFEHGNLFHLIANMTVVLSLGTRTERALGPSTFVQVSFFTAIGGGIGAALANYDVPTVGASGMILGWVGVLLPLATDAWRRILTNMVIQVALFSLIPGVSWQGHLGGFLVGLGWGYVLRSLITARRS